MNIRTKFILLLLAATFSFQSVAFSQDYGQKVSTHDYREFSFGIAPIAPFTFESTSIWHTDCCPWENIGIFDELYGETYGQVHYTPLYSFSYNRYYTRFFSLKTRFSFTCLYRAVYEGIRSEFDDIDVDACIFAMEMAQFTFLNRERVRLYGSVGLGMSIISSIPLPAVQVVPFGVSFGKHLIGFCELGLGTEYVGIHGGIGVRF